MRTQIAVLGLGVAAGLALAGADKKDEPARPEIVSPFVPSPPVVVEAMLKTAGVKEGDVVYDLGCGDGRIVVSAVRDFKAGKGVGIDFYPKRLKDCEKTVADAGLTDGQKKSLTFKQGDVLKLKPEDFQDVDVVTLYLLPAINRKLEPVLRQGLKPGARVVSHDFGLGDWQSEKTVIVTTDREHRVHLWVVKDKKK